MTAEGKLLLAALGAGPHVSQQWLFCVPPVPMATGPPQLMLGGRNNQKLLVAERELGLSWAVLLVFTAVLSQ